MIIQNLEYINLVEEGFGMLVLAEGYAHTSAYAYAGKTHAYAGFTAEAEGDFLSIQGSTQTSFKDVGAFSSSHAYSYVYAFSISDDYDVDISVSVDADYFAKYDTKF